MIKLYEMRAYETKPSEIRAASGLYADAFVGTDENKLLFLSVWGLDTAIQEFLGRLSLPVTQGGITDLYLNSVGDNHLKWYNINNINHFQKHTGRSFSKDSLFHHKIHLWLHDELTTKVDIVNHRCLLLKQQTQDEEAEKAFSTRLWEAVKTVCPVPLLDEWQPIMENFKQESWIKTYEGFGVDAWQLDFSSAEVESSISAWIREGQFTLPEEKLSFS